MLLIKLKAIFYIVIVSLLLVLGVLRSNGQGTSSRGTEFWTAYMEHSNSPFAGSQPSSMSLYITSDLSTTVKVDIADNSFSQSYDVTANQVKVIDIPADAFLSGDGKYLKGIHIVSPKPVAVYAHIYAGNASGATLLLPVNTLGKEYMSINYTQASNNSNIGNSDFVVIGTKNNTTVSITPAADLLDGHTGGQPFDVVLQQGEVYQARSRNDLTGSKIKSISTVIGECNKIAVFSGSSRIYIGCGSNLASDNLFQQVYPTSTWGKKYVTSPLSNRPFDLYRIIFSKPNTAVTLNGVLVDPSSFSTGFYEFSSTSSNVVTADQPIQVVQYTPTQGQGQGCSRANGDLGDPEMIFLSPIEQGLDRVTLYSSEKYLITQSYINVIIPTSATSSFMVDGVNYNNFLLVTADPAYSYAQVPVNNGTHNISASLPFNAIAYGFGNNESYGYAAGTNLKDLNNYVAFQDPADPDTTVTSGCGNTAYKLQLTLPYVPAKIKWTFDDGTPDLEVPAPVYSKTITRDNKLLYIYEYPTAKAFAIGSHSVVAAVTNPGADECGAIQEVRFDFITYEEITNAKITVDKSCFGTETEFTDATVLTTDRAVKKWVWDFGDGSPVVTGGAHIKHIYAASGHYNVRLTVTDNNGCVGVSPITPIYIATPPVIAFTVPANSCKDEEIVFKDNSTSADGAITKRAWDFGDGSPITYGAEVTHKYASTGPKTVVLTVTTDNGTLDGCVNSSPKIITIRPLPVVDFTLPQICENDYVNNISGEFTPSIAIADGTETECTYEWDFGDSARSTVANPNTSHSKNGRHQYTKAGDYTVKLTVFSKYGCATTVTKTFTVNSAPKAEFEFANDCSSRDIVFTDKSKVVTGVITKTVWWFDFDNHPEKDTTIYMPTGNRYTHNYGSFTGTTQPRSYTVKMTAYSGQSTVCTESISHTVTVYPEPVVSLEFNGATITDTIRVCEIDPQFQVMENKGIYSGNGEFTGTGISNRGVFNPRVAGAGTFVINYKFISDRGCEFPKIFVVVVKPTPRVSLDPSVVILSGDKIVLNAGATISSGTMKYTWSPSTGLDRTDVLKPVASPLKDIVYTLVVSTDKDCPADPVQIAVRVLQPPVIPNTFTPNSDGINDTWEIKYLDTYPGSTVEVFNRYGERMFASNGYSTPWDGRYRGNYLPTGTYYYIVSPKNGRKVISGYITIVR